MIIITGGAGFIGSAVAWKLNTAGVSDIIIVDELGTDEKWKNLVGLKYHDFINKYDFIDLIQAGTSPGIDAIIHMGANSSTTEKDADHLLRNNYEYTKILAKYSIENDIRLVYASSAATYGDGTKGFKDNDDESLSLLPLNMYGYSKNMFDAWALKEGMLDKIAGLKFFNVYGPNEYHKGDMRSVVHKAFEQIQSTGKVNLFKSGNADYKDGEQKRDFLYVKDAVDITLWFLENRNVSGIFNIGSGEARTWNDLVSAIFKAVGMPVNIEYINMPETLLSKYQYFTRADITKIKKAGYKSSLTSVEEGVADYVKNYLLRNPYLGMSNS
jgi:ADP-L-glycero-D-manno-heptose 6-epimerase